MKEFLCKELSHEVIGICIEIQKEYGNSHSERIYHRVLEEKLTSKGINFISKPKLKIYSLDSNKVLGYYEPDLLIENSIILELKAKPISINADYNQLLQYLKTTEYEIGYLINFGIIPLQFKRIIFSNNRKKFMLNVNNAKE